MRSLAPQIQQFAYLVLFSSLAEQLGFPGLAYFLVLLQLGSVLLFQQPFWQRLMALLQGFFS